MILVRQTLNLIKRQQSEIDTLREIKLRLLSNLTSVLNERRAEQK